jgi:hypothetical protein
MATVNLSFRILVPVEGDKVKDAPAAKAGTAKREPENKKTAKRKE